MRDVLAAYDDVSLLLRIDAAFVADQGAHGLSDLPFAVKMATFSLGAYAHVTAGRTAGADMNTGCSCVAARAPGNTS